ncbi:MAG: hypothetical protein IKP86_06245 [Anaerolineaceae bacterium]|nr:hypothetical protein [Anaerolineaceae bacterium]
MKNSNRTKRIRFISVLVPLAVFVLLTYGTLVNRLGFYWDDWPYVWTRLELGYHGLLRHFSFSRPVAGQIHNLAILITGGSPLAAQIWGLCAQVFGSFCAGLLIRNVWPNKLYAAVLTSLLFLAYPGFTMRPIAINFSFSYFLMGILFLSFILSVRAVKIDPEKPERCPRWIMIAAACLISLLNLFASEYFFLLELLRPCFLAAVIFRIASGSRREKLNKICRESLPYAAVFAAGLLYRMFFNRTQTLHYEFKLLSDLKSAPLPAIGSYLFQMGKDCLRVIFEAWAAVFEIPAAAEFGSRSTIIYALISGAVFCVAAVFLFLFSKETPEREFQTNGIMLVIGIFAMLLAGQPFWLTESAIHFVFQNCRYTLPFLLGISLTLSALLDCIRRPRILSVLAASVFIGLAAGHLFVVGNEYRRDWTLTKDFFTQLKWRVPGIAENTAVVTNVLPIRFSTDNSLTAPLNWIYAESYAPDRIPYILYTNTKREASLHGLEAGGEIFQEYLSAQFFGSTDDMISVYYQSPGCVHVLDPEVDAYNQMIPTIDREAALLNNYSRIRTDIPAAPLPAKQFGAENAHGWCWYYETADLERQRGNWEAAAGLGDKAFALNDHPNDPMELIPFIEAYAHTGRWQDALERTSAAMNVTPVMNDPLCALWNRITSDTEHVPVETELNSLLDCSFLRK